MNSDDILLKLEALSFRIGSTPCVPLKGMPCQVFAKLELFNLMGSIKDRPAFQILRNAISNGDIRKDTVVVESSSGNFAKALAYLCKAVGIRFVAVIDPNINKSNERFLNTWAWDVRMVKEKDPQYGYLGARQALVKRLLNEYQSSFWPNQYQNPQNKQAHEEGTAKEICDRFDRLDYAFIGAGTCGTLAACSSVLKKRFPKIRVIAVDAEGSAIFGGPVANRYIPGLGATYRPFFADQAQYDENISVSELDTVRGCQELLFQHGLFCGGSSGTVYEGMKRFLLREKVDNDRIAVFICPDGGQDYLDTVYDQRWIDWLQKQAGGNEA